MYNNSFLYLLVNTESEGYAGLYKVFLLLCTVDVRLYLKEGLLNQGDVLFLKNLLNVSDFINNTKRRLQNDRSNTIEDISVKKIFTFI